MMENYDYVRFLGQGSYGEVQLVKHVLEGKEYVLKKIGLHKASAKERFAAEQEAALLSQLKHINIVSYKQSFQLNGTLYIVMQYCEGGDLHTWLSNRKGRLLDELEIILWFVQIALALQYLHAKNILHRDLKTQNIFLTHKNEIIKLGDLGIARQLSGTNDMARTIIGTPYYMSPELFSNRPYNFKSDVWSLGCVVYEMCTMKHAFRARDFSGLAYKICTGKVPPLPDKFSTELSCLVSSMLEQEPEDRPNVSEILHLKFIRTYIQMFIKRNRGNNASKPKIGPKSEATKTSSDEKSESAAEQRIPRPRRTNSVETSIPSSEDKPAVTAGHCPHIRQQSNRHNTDKNNKSNQRCDEADIPNRPSSKRLSNSNHLALIPSVKDLLKKDESKINESKDSAFRRDDSKRRSSKDGLKYIEPDQPIRSQSEYNVIEPQPIPAPISSARKRRIEDKRKRSRSADRTSPDLFSSLSSDSPSPTLDIEKQRPPSPATQCNSRPQSPIIHTRSQSPGIPTRSQSPVLPSSRPQSPVCPPRSQSPAIPLSSPVIRPASPSLNNSRPPSPCQSSSRPESPCRQENKTNTCIRSRSPAARAPSPAARAPSPGLPPSPHVKKKSTSKSKYRPLPPTPPSVKAGRRKTKSQSEEQKLVDLMNETLALKDTPELDTPVQDTAPERDEVPFRPLPPRTEQTETSEPPQMSRLRNRLERLRNQVLPCVSREVLEKAYRVLDESDPDKVQKTQKLHVKCPHSGFLISTNQYPHPFCSGFMDNLQVTHSYSESELVLLVGNTPPGLCNKVMELYICQQRLREKNSLFQSI